MMYDGDAIQRDNDIGDIINDRADRDDWFARRRRERDMDRDVDAGYLDDLAPGPVVEKYAEYDPDDREFPGYDRSFSKSGMDDEGRVWVRRSA